MIVMGIDPGLANTGYGVVEEEGSCLRTLGYGGIQTSPGALLSERLDKIFSEMEELLQAYAPQAVAVEQLFFSANARSAMNVGEARGVIILAAQRAGVEIGEYTPLQVKQAMVGNGRATKDQVKYMVQAILGIKEKLPSSHAADALAMALCHLQYGGLKRRIDGAT
jgi:crossover junction endodeoxyribonuclease RuvC